MGIHATDTLVQIFIYSDIDMNAHCCLVKAKKTRNGWTV